MSLSAVLTLGWPEPPEGAVVAAAAHKKASQRKDYVQALARQLKGESVTIHSLERLFRRRPGGFGDLKRLIAALGEVDARGLGPVQIRCEIDAHAYGFLKGAKNLDLLLPEEPGSSGTFRRERPQLVERVAALEELERLGIALPLSSNLSKVIYMDLRAVMARASARDEKRTLAALVVSGPSTPTDIEEDLGISESLARRTLNALARSGVVAGPAADKTFRVTEEGLPYVTFLLREVLGLDYLGIAG